MATRYRTIVADPPWPIRWSGGRRKAGASSGSVKTHAKHALPYKTMEIADLERLPIATVAHTDSHLFLWTLDRFVLDGSAQRVARAWGFEPLPQMLVWPKNNAGLGRYLRPAHELILLARRGAARFHEAAIPTVQPWPQVYENGAKKHSAKPPEALEMVQSLAPGPYLELFAREATPGWDVWGNQAPDSIDIDGAHFPAEQDSLFAPLTSKDETAPPSSSLTAGNEAA